MWLCTPRSSVLLHLGSLLVSVEMSVLPVLKKWSIMVSRGAAQARSSLLNLAVFPGVFYRFDLQSWLKI